MTTGLTRAVSPLARHNRFYAAAMGDRLAGGNTAPLSPRSAFDPLGHFTAILLYGRRILQRWYDEAGIPTENMQLIQRLESIANRDALTGTATVGRSMLPAAIWQQKRRWR